jgi:DNA-binding CsgD family transcriptional regulator
VLVLDDLHWADRSTLLLLQHLTREVADSSLLVIGTYRDVEVDRAHPLREVLTELSREPAFERIRLRGLSESEVAAYAAARFAVAPAGELVRAVSERTEGNPFFMREVVSLMQERSPGESDAGAVALPEGVRDAVGRRLDRLSEQCDELLRTAAVVGREFSEELLARLSDGGTEQVPELLETALGAGLIEETERPGEYHFTHALIQETLLDEVRASQRVTLHARIAEALEERHGDRAAEHAAELAPHFVESAVLGRKHAERAVRYSKLAGEQAEAQTAWAEAAHHYENCLTMVDEAPDDLGQDEADLLTSLGVCYCNANALRDAWPAFMRAITIYRDRGDAESFARATLELTRIVFPADRILPQLQEALSMLGTRDPQLEARLHAELLRWIYRSYLDPGEIDSHRARAWELAQQHGYPDVEAAISHGDVVSAQLAGAHAEAARLGLDAHARWDALGMWNQAADSRHRATDNALWAGRLSEGLDMAEHNLAYTRRFHLRSWEERVAPQLVQARVLRAEWDAVTALLDEYGDCSDPRLLVGRALSRLVLADVAGAQQALPPADAGGGYPREESMVRATRARVFLAAGDRAAAESEYRAMEAASAADPRGPEASGWRYSDESICTLDEAFVELAETPVLRAWFDAEPGRAVFIGPDCLLLSRARVGLALGEDGLAYEALEEALEVAKRERAPIIEGRCHQGLAEVAERRGQRAEALAHLEAAAALFEQHGAKLYLDQVIARQEELRAAPGGDRPSYPDGLSEREVEVLRLVAAGKSNAQIADALVIAPATAARHVHNILTKAALSNRAELAAYALRHGLAE